MFVFTKFASFQDIKSLFACAILWHLTCKISSKVGFWIMHQLICFVEHWIFLRFNQPINWNVNKWKSINRCFNDNHDTHWLQWRDGHEWNRRGTCVLRIYKSMQAKWKHFLHAFCIIWLSLWMNSNVNGNCIYFFCSVRGPHNLRIVTAYNHDWNNSIALFISKYAECM